MRYSKTSLMELSHRYGKILRKCAFLNAAILMGVMIASPAMAARVSGILDTDTTIEGKTFENEVLNVASGSAADGAALQYSAKKGTQPKLTITNSVFTKNTLNDADKANGAYGGAVSIGGGINVVMNTVTMSQNQANLTGESSAAKTQGGAYWQSTGTLAAEKLKVSNNSTSGTGGNQGGAMALFAVNGTITDSTFSQNRTTATNGSYPNQGGALYLTGASWGGEPDRVMKITDSTFNQNTINSKWAYGGAISVSGAKVNQSDKTKNAYYTLELDDVDFSNNSVSGDEWSLGGVMYANNAKLIISNSDFSNNTATSTQDNAEVRGGALYLTTNDTTGDEMLGVTSISDSDFTSNKAENGTGGAIYNVADLTISDTDFKTNTATLSAGAIYNSGSLSVKDSEFDGNVSKTGWGGAIYSGSTGNMTIEGSTFKNNIAYNAGAIGAGTKTTGTIIKNSTFENNSAEAYGAVALFKNGELDNVTFKGNKATGTKTLTEDGKAVNHGAGALFLGAESVVKITKGSFDGNTSGTRGGAIATRMPDVANNQAAKLDIDGTVFSNNIAKTEGGAIYSSFYNSQEVVNNVLIKNATFTNNQANEGGAIYNEGLADVGGNKASMYIENSTFEGNIATTNGGALFISEGGNLTLAGKNTFSGNKAAGVLNDIHNLGSLKISGDLTLDGGISGNGTIAFTGATTLTAQLKSSASILGTATGLGNVTVAGLIVENGLTDATYNLFENGDAAFAKITATNALYTFEQGGNGQIKVTKKSTEQITENLVSSGATEQEAITISAIADSKSDNPVISSISVAVQTGNTAEAVKAVQELAPTTSQQVMGVAQSVNSLLSNVTGTRMAALGRAGGDTFVGGSVWAQGLYNHTKQDATAAAAGFSADTAGVAFGVDGKVNEDITVGVGYGYNQTDADSAGRDIDVEGHNFFAYAQYQPDAWYINGMFSYGFSKYTEDKAPMGVAMTAKYDVNTYAANVMSGYQFDDGITTEAGLRYVLADQKAYSDGAQYISTDTNDVLTAVVGVKYSTDYKAKDWTIKPSVRLAATYDILSDDSQANVSIIGGGNYQITGDRLHRFGVETGVGVTGTIKDWDLTLEYNGGFRQDYQSHTGMLKAKYNF